MRTRSSTTPIAKPELRAAIVRVLVRRGISPDELPDLTQDVLADLLVMTRPPEDPTAWFALAGVVAQRVAVDTIRRKARRRASNAGPCGDPDERASRDQGAEDASAEGALILDSVVSGVKRGVMPARMLVVLRGLCEGMPHREIAEELGVACQTVRNDLAALRRALRCAA